MLKKILKIIFEYFCGGIEYRINLNLRALLYFKAKGRYRFARFIANRMQRKYSIFISPKTSFDETLKLRHPVAIVIGEGVRLGRNVIIYQNVTLGGARLGDGAAKNYPEIGDNTVIFSGAAIIGDIKIGKNCIIGANSVVTIDLPDNCTAAGVPARIIKKSIL
ncbi:MAG: serine acetyltransferase [Moraxellaceae bacterium]|nr:serine acetyltransferase [Moraxellaceae bacterium]MDZ4386027.1 serine acetyltransferase [Moraxellaceae bacterium]